MPYPLNPRIAALLTFLDPFNEYDREEHCRKFASTDPNHSGQLRQVLDQEYFVDTWYSTIPLDAKR